MIVASNFFIVGCSYYPSLDHSVFRTALMTLDEIKQALQEHFAERMVTIVGSGLSAAVGLPSMSTLAKTLLSELPGLLNLITVAKWQLVADQLDAGADLETALKNYDDDDLNQQIRTVVARHIGRAEKAVVAQLYKDSLILAFLDCFLC